MEFSKNKLITLVFLRLLIGWHFFYEGMVKLLDSGWSSKIYLLDSAGFAKPFFEWLAGNQMALQITDKMNVWGLTLIGFFLISGLFVRYASFAGMILLALYYLSHPAIPGAAYIFPSDGSYFLVNKTIIELAALGVIYAFPTAHIFGLERIMNKITGRI